MIAGLVLAVAAVVALWPRDSGEPSPTVSAPPPGPDITTARAAAALPGCQVGPGGPAELRGASAMCLGDGSTVDSAAALGGRPVLLNVWATWCQPCREELPVLAAYAAEPNAVPVVTLAVESKPADSLDLLAALGVRLPTLHDGDGSVRRALRVPAGLPASYLITADGTVKRITDPLVFRSTAAVREAVARDLGGAR
ncbi:thiol-disulfide isomerase/thioredoxin [Herbihabitans rhizosphaerae]|uniref:Thiol-disulfide isomerase/thioredoxin n=1 Tax=Herbihabitans rhizosphaerae TaxID=1872711 RepID=A0A4Q7KWX0_9PSEU|nr:thiol-disulfide isomerase/thioredoxin [Herbihabitans rhizosphaerae]